MDLVVRRYYVIFLTLVLPQVSASKNANSLGWFCKNRKDGQLHKDPDDCRAYIYCSGGYDYRARCDEGLFYDHEAQACNYNNGQCAAKDIKSRDVDVKQSYKMETKYPDKKYLFPVQDDVPAPPSTQHMIIEEYQQKEDHKSNLGIQVSETMCINRLDGTYEHPTDCRAYVLCSNGIAYAAYCPKGLMYSRQHQGCDFDIELRCPLNKVTKGHRTAWTHVPSQGNTSPYFTTSPKYPEPDPDEYNTDSGDTMSKMLPEAVQAAMTSLMKKLEIEAKMAAKLSDRNHHSSRTVGRPFRMVQRFLKAKPLAKHLSLPGYIITNASYIIIQRLKVGKDDVATLLRAVSSPLSASRHRLRADDAFPKPEPGVCPWPKYTCEYSQYRSVDGSCNNLQHPLWGRSFIPFQRFLPPDYGDMMSSMRRAKDGGELPDARRISFTVHTDVDKPHYIHTTMLLQWGQFIDHDLALTAISKISVDPSGTGETVDIECGEDGCDSSIDNCEPMRIPGEDPVFHDKCLEFVRSEGVPDLNCSMGPRQQLDQLSSFIDASNMYGSSSVECHAMRNYDQPQRGQLRFTAHPQGKKDLLPTTTEDQDCNEVNPGFCFLGGDERVNEQSALTTMHTFWMRQHNRIEAILHNINKHWDGETLFQETRKIIGAMIQHITFNEFLPVVLGRLQMEKYDLILQEEGFYKGYDSSVNPTVANSFATAAYRFGHSLLVGKFKRYNKEKKSLPDVELSEMFFRPSQIMDEKGDQIDGFVRGLCSQKVQSVDRHVTEQVTSKLFSQMPPDGLGTDLVSLNIQRGRDHGLPGYNKFRKWCGLAYAKDFDDLVEIDLATRRKFRQLYRDVDDIDLFPGGIAEKNVRGGLVGPTFACIIGKQFRNIKKGDRFWYENAGKQAFTMPQLNEVRKATLAKVICENTDDITLLQERVMELPLREAYPDITMRGDLHGLNDEWFARLWTSDYNHRVNCSCISDIDLTKWAERPV